MGRELDMACDSDDPRVLDRLSKSEDERLRAAVAHNTACPRRIRNKLLNDKSIWVRMWAALGKYYSEKNKLKKS